MFKKKKKSTIVHWIVYTSLKAQDYWCPLEEGKFYGLNTLSEKEIDQLPYHNLAAWGRNTQYIKLLYKQPMSEEKKCPKD